MNRMEDQCPCLALLRYPDKTLTRSPVFVIIGMRHEKPFLQNKYKWI